MLFEEDDVGVEEAIVRAGLAEGMVLGRALGAAEGARIGNDNGWALGMEVWKLDDDADFG